MKKNTSKEAYFKRLQELAEVKNPQSKSKSIFSGTLIDYKSGDDGNAYGIIKENHNYFIKKGKFRDNLDISDFVYIGGLENITDYQYNSLAEADKQRNMLLTSISESFDLKPNKSGTKLALNEDKVGKEIQKADSALGGLKMATEKEKETTEMPKTPIEIAPDEQPTEIPNMDDMDGSSDEPVEMPSQDVGDETDITADDLADPIKEIEKMLGKVTNNIRKTELEPTQVKSFINSFISAFKDKLPEVEIEDRKEMANKILKVVSDKEIEDLGDVVSDEPSEEIGENEKCSECGSFMEYAQSRGYDQESMSETTLEEKTNLISGYANAYNEGMNDGDFETVSMYSKDDICETLINEYGHDEYVSKLKPFTEKINEMSEEDVNIKLNELWAGLSQLGKKAGQAIGQAAQKTGQAVGGAYTDAKHAYYSGEKNAAITKLEQVAADLGRQIATVNDKAVKAGQEPINIQSILTTIKNQVGVGSRANLSKYKTTEGVVDPANIETQPNMVSEDIDLDDELFDDEDEIKNEPEIDNAEPSKPITFAPEADNLGIGGLKSEEKNEIEIKDSTVNITMNENDEARRRYPYVVTTCCHTDWSVDDEGNKICAGCEEPTDVNYPENLSREPAYSKNDLDESKTNKMTNSEMKLRKYVRLRIQESLGIKKPKLNEDVKSENLKKLDKMIDEQLKLFSNISKKSNGLSENNSGDVNTNKPLYAITPEQDFSTWTIYYQAHGNESGIHKSGYGRESLMQEIGNQNIPILYGGGLDIKYILNTNNQDVNGHNPYSKNNLSNDQYVKGLLANGGQLIKSSGNEPNDNVNEVLGLSLKEKFKKIDPNNYKQVKDMLYTVYDVLKSTIGEAIERALKNNSQEEKYELLKKYFENNGGTLRTGDVDGITKVVYAPQSLKDKSTPSQFTSGGTRGKTRLGGI